VSSTYLLELSFDILLSLSCPIKTYLDLKPIFTIKLFKIKLLFLLLAYPQEEFIYVYNFLRNNIRGVILRFTLRAFSVPFAVQDNDLS